MIKYLTKSTIELRVADEDAADELHKQMQEEAGEIGAVLTAWNESLKERKSKGEVVESWVIVKYTLTFNDPKEPEIPLDKITYNMSETLPGW